MMDGWMNGWMDKLVHIVNQKHTQNKSGKPIQCTHVVAGTVCVWWWKALLEMRFISERDVPSHT